MSKKAMSASSGKDPATDQDQSREVVVQNLAPAEEVDTQGVEEAKAEEDGDTSINRDGADDNANDGDSAKISDNAGDNADAGDSAEALDDNANASNSAKAGDDNADAGNSAKAGNNANAGDSAEAADNADGTGDADGSNKDDGSVSDEETDEAAKSESSEIFCGLCLQIVPDKFTTPVTSFKKSCLCCKFEYFNHDTCATNHVNNHLKCIHHDEVAKAKKNKQPYTSKVNLHSKISIHQFNQSISAYYCKNCEQKQCFKCTKQHTLSNTCRKVACVKCGLKWSVMAIKCRKDAEKIVCNDCKSKSDQSSSEQSSTNLSDKPTSNLKRFNSHQDPNYQIYPTVSSDKEDTIKTFIKNAFQIETEEADKFRDEEHAKRYFFTKLNYLPDFSKNLFVFECPEQCPKLKETPFEHENMFSVSFNDVCTLFGSKGISPGMVDFVIQCLNFYNCVGKGNDLVPSDILGPTSDLNRIIPSKENYNNLHQSFHSRKTKNSLTDEQLTITLKDWYVNHDKGVLTSILDKFKAMGKKLDHYVSILQLTTGAYTVYRTHIGSSLKESKIATYDYTNEHATETQMNVVWLAKFFGLYVKESSNVNFEDADFEGLDLVENLFNHNALIDNEDASMLEIDAKSLTKRVTKSNDTGIYCLAHCLAWSTKTIFGSIIGETEKERKEYVKHFKLSVLKLIANIYEELHETNYQILSTHIMMKNGTVNKTDLAKWRMIHDLFNKNVYRINVKKGNHANGIWKKNTYNQILKLHNKHFPSKATLKQQEKKRKSDREPVSEEVIKKMKMTRQANQKKSISLEYLWLHRTLHTRQEPIFWISNKIVITHPDADRSKTIDDIEEDNMLTPENVATEVRDLFYDRYRKHGASDEENNKLYEQIKKDMMKHEVFIAFDRVINSDSGTKVTKSYNVVAAAIIEEELVFQNGSTCAIIHLMATEFDFENGYQLKTLLSRAFSKDHMINKDVVFVYKYAGNSLLLTQDPKNKASPTSYTTFYKLMNDMNFVPQDLPTVVDDIRKDSSCMIGHARDLVKGCEKELKDCHESKLQKVKVCRFNNAVKIKFRYLKSSNDGFEVYSHTFGWHNGNREDFTRVAHERKNLAKDNLGTEYILSGRGHRGAASKVNVPEFNKEFPIPPNYRQESTGPNSNNCVWLSAACLIRQMNQKDGNKMIHLFKNHKSKFDWLHIREPKDPTEKLIEIQNGREPLQIVLQRDIGYNLKGATKVDTSKCYIDYLMNHASSGKYVVVLKFGDGDDNHVVGIDLDNNLIWDAADDFALHFNMNNLNYCCGKDGESIKSIPMCYYIYNNKMKRKYDGIPEYE